MDFKNLVDKAKAALGKNPTIIDKAGDFVDGKTGGKYSSQVNKAQDAAKKFAGNEQNKADEAELNLERDARDPQGPPQQQ